MKELIRKIPIISVLSLLVLLSFSACRKHHHTSKKDVNRLSDADSLRFYIWHIAVSDSSKPIPSLKDQIWGWVPSYYWEKEVPQNLKWFGKQFKGSDLEKTGNNLMKGIASFSTKFDGFPEDRYSFIDVQGTISQELQGGVKGDFGYKVGGALDGNDHVHLFIESVYDGSPSGNKGVQRGDEILSINGNTNMDTRNQNNLDRINKDLFLASSVQLELKRPDQSTYQVNLDRTQYHINPVLFNKIYNEDGKKIGYFVYNSFVAVGNEGNGVRAKEEIDSVFEKFKTEDIDELIVDLRYNGGGSVASSEYLADLIAPASAVGQEMYHYEYNQPLTSFFESDDEFKQIFLDPVNFKENSNNLDLSRVFFITSNGTASAAELLMNNLKPYMDVEILGSTTNGKPVGFFSIPISFVTQEEGYQHVADMYAINFKSVNKEGTSDYYAGMDPDVNFNDYVFLNWGKDDPTLQSIFNKIDKGSYLQEADLVRKMKSHARQVSGSYPQILRKSRDVKLKKQKPFDGMIDYERSRALRQIHKALP